MKAHGMGSQMVEHWDCQWETKKALMMEHSKADHWDCHWESSRAHETATSMA